MGRAIGAAALALALALVARAGTDEVPLGSSEEQLRERYGEALRELSVERPRSLHERVDRMLRGAPEAPAEGSAERPGPAAPYPGQRRLARSAAAPDLRGVEYDLHEGRIYRIRWRLAERFERPLMQPLVAALTRRLGPPRYDQTIEAALGSGRADLRRSGWARGGRALEVRQLQPFVGGPLFATLSDTAALQAIVDGRGTPLPQPEAVEAWWRSPAEPVEPLAPEERDALVTAVDALLKEMAF